MAHIPMINHQLLILIIDWTYPRSSFIFPHQPSVADVIALISISLWSSIEIKPKNKKRKTNKQSIKSNTAISPPLTPEAGAGEEKDNIWRAAQEKVWNARRLWMGRGVTGMAQRRLSLLVA
nr:hypothetical protein CFP56_28916 [Quercus suber]